jgi:hypothetical protein
LHDLQSVDEAMFVLASIEIPVATNKRNRCASVESGLKSGHSGVAVGRDHKYLRAQPRLIAGPQGVVAVTDVVARSGDARRAAARE